MKMVIDWKAQTLLDLINTMHGLVHEQFIEVNRSLTGKGVFELNPSYKKYEM